MIYTDRNDDNLSIVVDSCANKVKSNKEEIQQIDKIFVKQTEKTYFFII